MLILFYKFWPVWMKLGFWYSIFYYICGYSIMICVRVLIWLVFYHIGVDLWLFPNYFDSYYNPKKFLWPVASFRKRPDCFSPASLVFRAISGYLIFYICRQFTLEEKIYEDYEELRAGFNEFIEYGEDFLIGNQLSDGNRTQTFDEKLKQEMKNIN